MLYKNYEWTYRVYDDASRSCSCPHQSLAGRSRVRRGAWRKIPTEEVATPGRAIEAAPAPCGVGSLVAPLAGNMAARTTTTTTETLAITRATWIRRPPGAAAAVLGNMERTLQSILCSKRTPCCWMPTLVSRTTHRKGIKELWPHQHTLRPWTKSRRHKRQQEEG